MDVREIPLAQLHPAEWNANRVPEKTLAKVRRSIERYGVVENLVVRPHPEIPDGFEVLSGNHRLSLFGELGHEVAACHVVEVDDAHARLLAQTLNRTRGDDDPEAYALLLEDVLAAMPAAEAVEVLPETEHSIDRVLAQFGTRRGLQDIDDAPPLPDEPESVLGEVYEFGRHRLMCGDAADEAQVEELLRGEDITLIVTDPPYGVDYANVVGGRENQKQGGWRDIAGDQLPDAELEDLVMSAISQPARTLFLWYSAKRSEVFFRAVRAAGYEVAQQIIWVKNALVFGGSDYQWRHEPCIYARRRGSRCYGARTETTVWEEPKSVGAMHPTQKPAGLYRRAIANHSRPGEVIYDPFGGSGTALLAAEEAGRRAYVMEVDPGYCDVARSRYARIMEAGLVAA